MTGYIVILGDVINARLRNVRAYGILRTVHDSPILTFLLCLNYLHRIKPMTLELRLSYP